MTFAIAGAEQPKSDSSSWPGHTSAAAAAARPSFAFVGLSIAASFFAINSKQAWTWLEPVIVASCWT